MKTLAKTLALALCLAAPSLPAADCDGQLEIESFTEFFFSATDLLQTVIPDLPGPLAPVVPNPLKIPANLTKITRVGDSFQNGCVTLDWFSGGVKFSVGNGAAPSSTGSGYFSFDASAPAAGSYVGRLPWNSSVNKLKDPFIPTIKPCGEHPVLRLAHLAGDVSGYVFDAGAGVYPRRTTKGRLHICRDLVVENASASPIELPITLSGSLFIMGGIAADNSVGDKNYAKTWLKVTGSVAGQAIMENEELSASGPALAADQEKLINTTRRVIIAPGTGAFPVHIDLECEGRLEIQAHGSALFGLIANAVTAQVQFPNSIDIGLPTGPGGAPLPPGVRIYDASDGSVYADTTASPVPVVPVPMQTHIWDFATPFDAGLGALTPAAHTVTAHGDTTLLSPPGTGAGLVRRSDADADPLANAAAHNAFRLTYTVHDTNTTPAITVFVYDQPGGTPRALAYDLPLSPGYHEAILRHTAGDAGGRGLFAPGYPDLTRLHSIAIGNTLIPEPSTLNQPTTGQLAVTFHHLSAMNATGYDGFAITNHFLDTNGLLHLVYPANTNDYYLAYWGETVTGITNPFALALGADGAGEFRIVDDGVGTARPRALQTGEIFAGTSRPRPAAFFRLREVPFAHPLDVDGDGFDDLTEYRSPALNPFVPNTVNTNAPPAGDTNSTSGQVFLWTANNHRYMPVAVSNGITWTEADAAARAVGGHLATLTSAAENAFVFTLIDRPEFWMAAGGPPPCCNVGPWLGGVQTEGAPEPAGSWQWVTAEPFDFTAWNPGEPNNNTDNSNRLQYFTAPASPRRANWNDAPATYRAPGYVIEFEPPATGGDCIPRNGLVAWWKGDGNALDSAGNSHGTLINGIGFAPGKVGTAFSLDGFNDYADLGTSPALHFVNSSFTVMAWIYLTGPSGGDEGIVTRYPFSGGSWILGRFRDGTLWFAIDTDGGWFPDRYAGSTQVASLETWHHVAGTYDHSTGTLSLFVDGQAAATSIGPPVTIHQNSNGKVSIGSWWSYDGGGNAPALKGLVDEVILFSRALESEEIAGIYSGGITGRCQPQCVPPPPGLVAWWPGEGNANDVIGGNNGTLHGGATFAPGLVGQALSLDGVDDYASAEFTYVGPFTVELWAKAASVNQPLYTSVVSSSGLNQQTPFFQMDMDGAGNYRFHAGSDELYVGLGSAKTSWQHLAVTVEGGTVKTYLDGVLGNTGLWPGLPLRFASVKVGINRQENLPFAGQIDEVAVYDRALSATDIAALYLTGSAGKCPVPECAEPPTGLVAWWPAEGNANDVVGSHHGTLQNGVTFAPGLTGQAFSLDGADDFVAVPDDPVFSFGQKMTAAAWIYLERYPENWGRSGGIISQYDSHAGLDDSWGFSVYDSGVLGFSVHSPDGREYYFVKARNVVVPLGRFTQAAASVDLSIPSIRLFLHGVEIATDVVAGSVNIATFRESASPIRIGASICFDGRLCDQFPGLIDDPMIFNRALSAAEIQALYQSVAVPPAGPVVDHGGADWTVTPGEVIGGAHVNIGEFTIPSAVTAEVAPFDGTGGGSVEIRARTIRVAGTLDATGQGYPGGGGGGGGGGGDQLEADGGNPGNRGHGGTNYLAGSNADDGTPGRERRGGDGGFGGIGFAFSDGRPSFPGTSGPGAAGGENPGHNPIGDDGLPGGYLAPGANGDTTVGDEVHPGFGGGGGGGGGGGHSRDVNSGGGGGGGGGSGGFGGGAIILRASQRLEVSGTLLAQGTLGTNGASGTPGQPYNMANDPSPGGNGGNGAPAGLISANSSGGSGGANACDTFGAQAPNCSGPGGRGGNGGAGAGGGILLRAPLVSVSGTINNTGGSGATANGGTVKIYSTCGGQNVKGTVTTGRLVAQGILMRPSDPSTGTGQPTVTVSYQPFDGAPLQLYPWRGERVALLTPASDFDAATMRRIVTTFDRVHDYYRTVTGRTPQPARTLDGLTTIAVVPDTCGAGCAYLGFTGIEMLPEWFHTLYTGVKDRSQFDQVVFYEFGRNFWFYSASLEYKAPEDGGSVVTGYAVLMRFLAMEAAGVAGGSFNGVPFPQFRQIVEGLVDTYAATPTLNWENTLAVGQAPPNPMNLGGADLFASFVLRLRRDHGGEGFIRRLWLTAATRPAASTTQQAVDNLVIAASVAANLNLADRFTVQWRWPLSEAARVELAALFPSGG